MPKKILITGGNGFLGKNLIARLHARGDEVCILIRLGDNRRFFDCRYIPINFFDQEALKKATLSFDPEIIVNLACSRDKSVEYHRQNFSSDENYQISRSVIKASLLSSRLRKFIHIGSCDEYGASNFPYTEGQTERPMNNYGLSKLTIKRLLIKLKSKYKFPCVILRPSVIYGPGQSEEMFIPSLMSSLLKGIEFPMTLGEQIRDFIYVDDIVEAILLSIDKSVNTNISIINIATGMSLKVKDVAIIMAQLISENSEKLLKFGELGYRKDEVFNYVVDNTLALDSLGWSPRLSIYQGLQKTLIDCKSLKNKA